MTDPTALRMIRDASIAKARTGDVSRTMLAPQYIIPPILGRKRVDNIIITGRTAIKAKAANPSQ